MASPTPRTGRPPKPEHKRLTETISVRFTKTEYRKINRRADQSGLDLREFVKQRLLSSVSV